MAEELSVELAAGLRFAWNRRAVAALARETPPTGRVWQADGALERYGTLRVLSGTLADGGLLLVAAARPAAADGHDADDVAALVVDADGHLQVMEQVLLSTQYAPDGSVRRIGLELYPPDEDFPLRAAGDAERSGTNGDGRERVDWARLALRLDGRTGIALFEVVHSP